MLPYCHIWTHETPSTKFEFWTKKSSFLLVLAWVNAQTPRRAKMKILTDIIRRACKHFNIDPKDLCDDHDSSAQSKSSSREPAEGDENWDALDTTKRCTITAIISWKLIKGESRNVRISARRDAKSWKGVQGGARGRKWCWRYIWRCFWSVFVIETIIQEVLVLSLFFLCYRGFKFCARGFMGSNMAIWEQGIFLPN